MEFQGKGTGLALKFSDPSNAVRFCAAWKHKWPVTTSKNPGVQTLWFKHQRMKLLTMMFCSVHSVLRVPMFNSRCVDGELDKSMLLLALGPGSCGCTCAPGPCWGLLRGVLPLVHPWVWKISALKVIPAKWEKTLTMSFIRGWWNVSPWWMDLDMWCWWEESGISSCHVRLRGFMDVWTATVQVDEFYRNQFETKTSCGARFTGDGSNVVFTRLLKNFTLLYYGHQRRCIW